MTHHTRFARSFARTVPTPEAIKSLSIGMFRFGAVRFGAVRFARAVGVCRRARFPQFPQFSLRIFERASPVAAALVNILF